jgi:hypothetical protein
VLNDAGLPAARYWEEYLVATRPTRIGDVDWLVCVGSLEPANSGIAGDDFGINAQFRPGRTAGKYLRITLEGFRVQRAKDIFRVRVVCVRRITRGGAGEIPRDTDGERALPSFRHSLPP